MRFYFATGSVAKLAQASLVFERLGLPLAGSLAEHTNGIEDYFGDVEQLINQKLSDVSLGLRTVYFVEDTYISIAALSSETEAQPGSADWTQATVPGLKAKEWFSQTSFEELDEMLKDRGNERRATVYSTVGLRVPGAMSNQLFTGQTVGTIAHQPGNGLSTNQGYPWLDPASFNGWFIPEGEDVPLSDLDLARALNADFRVSALLLLAERLEEYVAILNLPPVSFELVTHKDKQISYPQLFPTRRPPIAVIGHTCAGKTTLGEMLNEFGYEHVEASSILRDLQQSDVAPNSRPGYFQAMTMLSSSGWDIIARRAVELYHQYIESGLCITGLRTIEELHYLLQIFDDLIVVLLEASEQSRFERYISRRRPGDDTSLTRYREREQEHASFGLIGIAEHIANMKVSNNSTLAELRVFAKLLAQHGPDIECPNVTRRGLGFEVASRSQIYRCALALQQASRPLSPAEVEELQLSDSHPHVVKRNAVRKTLAEHPVLVRRASESGGTTLYELTDHGRAYVSLLYAMNLAPSQVDSVPQLS